MISCDRRRALLTTLILLARMICQTLCWPTLNCFYLSHFVLLFARRCFILQVYIFEYVNVFFLKSCSVQMVNVSPFPQFCTKHFYQKPYTAFCLAWFQLSYSMHCTRILEWCWGWTSQKSWSRKPCAQKPESVCEKEDRLIHLYRQLSIHISVCLAFCEIDYGLFRNEACPPFLRS